MIRKQTKVLIIPDVHLKPWMFDEADKIMESGQADIAVFMGDLFDDWGKEFYLNLYEDTIKRAIEFHEKYPSTLWCIGNHDFSYMYGYSESGYSYAAQPIAKNWIYKLKDAVGYDKFKYIHRIDNLIFSHGGITMEYIDEYAIPKESDNVRYEFEHEQTDFYISVLNALKPTSMWHDTSPMWTRPNYYKGKMYSNGYLQVVGHTPVKKPTFANNCLITDTFSTYSNHEPIGDNKFIIINSITKKYEYAKQ